ncbi:MAG: DUF3808 domain-containing protein [Nitrospinae bacterium]|nr:DUF3808 domain-containing protein [Nitrospinota bacterium]
MSIVFIRRCLYVIVALFFFAPMLSCTQKGARVATKEINTESTPLRVNHNNKPEIYRDVENKLEGYITGLKNLHERSHKYNDNEKNFILVYDNINNQRWKEAKTEINNIDGKSLGVEDHLLYYRALIENRLENSIEANQLFEQLLIEHGDSVWQAHATIEKAKALIGMKKEDLAIQLLNDFKDNAPYELSAEAENLYAKALINAKRKDVAIAQVKKLLLSASSEDVLKEYEDLVLAVKKTFGVNLSLWLQHPEQQFQLSETFVNKSQWDEAAVRLESTLKRKDLKQSYKVKVKWLLAKCYKRVHRYDEAIELINELLQDPYAQKMEKHLLKTLAIVYTKKDEYDKALPIWNTILEQNLNNSRKAASIKYTIAFLYIDQGKYAEAIPLLDEIAKTRNVYRKKRTLARWHLSWCHYMLKDYKNALKGFDSLLQKGAKRALIYDRVTYWKARALEKDGQEKESKKLFAELELRAPNSYYGELSKRKLGEVVSNTNGFVHVNWDGSEKSFWNLPNTKIKKGNFSEHLSRAITFDYLGLHEEVLREISQIDFKVYPSDIIYAMSLASNNYGHNISLKIRKKAYRKMLKSYIQPDKLKRFIVEKSYPRAYLPIVNQIANKYDLDPMYVWALMRTESAFRPKVVSSAGAVGLMQLMPTTANRMIAGSINEKVDKRELYNPVVNINFGAAYLNKLKSYFPENIVAVTASYNAGEEAVARWIKNGKKLDIEEWVEEIPYKETNLYVKKVMAAYWNYQRLYKPQNNQMKVVQTTVTRNSKF